MYWAGSALQSLDHADAEQKCLGCWRVRFWLKSNRFMPKTRTEEEEPKQTLFFPNSTGACDRHRSAK